MSRVRWRRQPYPYIRPISPGYLTLRLPFPSPSQHRRSRGQTTVEFALILPVMILLLLMALDFGRTFLGWVSLNNAARVGANYAANHPFDTWGAGTEYQSLMTDNMDAINCTPNPDPADPPAFGVTRDPGELVRVNLNCDFSVITPVISAFFPGGTVTVSSTAAFPITFGCLGSCSGGPPVPPPPPPADNCRTVPNVEGLSVSGARLAWASAGFIASQFIPATGDDTLTVADQAVAESPNTEGCSGSERFFDSTMTVTTAPIEPVTPGCFTVPNLRGVTMAMAHTSWVDAGFTGEFLPATGIDDRVVVDQVTDAPSAPGDCRPPETTIVVALGSAYPAPPPQPCRVPSFVNESTAAAPATWAGAGFTGVIAYKPPGGLPYTVRAQSLVGGTFVQCTSAIELKKNP